jgi:signal transduction histidine kinase
VKDTGIGISADNQKKLFKLFGFIQETSAHNINGIGLGLVITQHIVHQYEGRVWVKSEIGEGSSFSFKLRHQNEADQQQGYLDVKPKNRYKFLWRPKNNSEI